MFNMKKPKTISSHGNIQFCIFFIIFIKLKKGRPAVLLNLLSYERPVGFLPLMSG